MRIDDIKTTIGVFQIDMNDQCAQPIERTISFANYGSSNNICLEIDNITYSIDIVKLDETLKMLDKIIKALKK